MKRGIEMKNIIAPLIVFIFLFCLIPVQATNQTDAAPENHEQYLSSLELFLQRKAYPYEDRALLDWHPVQEPYDLTGMN
jgi:hypothetical protein